MNATGVLVFVGLGILVCALGFRYLTISRERLWIEILKRNAARAVASPPALPESALRQTRIGGAGLLIMGILKMLLPLIVQLMMPRPPCFDSDRCLGHTETCGDENDPTRLRWAHFEDGLAVGSLPRTI